MKVDAPKLTVTGCVDGLPAGVTGAPPVGAGLTLQMLVGDILPSVSLWTPVFPLQ